MLDTSFNIENLGFIWEFLGCNKHWNPGDSNGKKHNFPEDIKSKQ